MVSWIKASASTSVAAVALSKIKPFVSLKSALAKQIYCLGQRYDQIKVNDAQEIGIFLWKLID
jgi:hypothetical protein